MNWLAMPPLSALRAFAALAQTRSMTAAGARLNVSHAAISQQVRVLERHLGLRLVAREGRGIALTAAGAQLSEAVSEGFAMIEGRIAALTEADADRPVQLSVTPMFAANWLMPQMADFRAAHPRLNLMINPTTELVELAPGGIDIAIRYGDGTWPGLEVEPLIATHFIVVAARSLIGEREIASPEELLDYPWIQELGTTAEADWLATLGVHYQQVRGLTQVPGNLLLDGLRSGQGVAATTRAFVEDDIAAGRLRILFESDRPGTGYYIVTRPEQLRPAAQAFRRWLRRRVDELSRPLSKADWNC